MVTNWPSDQGQSRHQFIPVIMQTAAGRRSEDLRRASEVGALGYITDPTDLDLPGRTRTLLEFKAYLDVCEEAAFTDHLTGLANRRRFERHWNGKWVAWRGLGIRSVC